MRGSVKRDKWEAWAAPYRAWFLLRGSSVEFDYAGMRWRLATVDRIPERVLTEDYPGVELNCLDAPTVGGWRSRDHVRGLMKSIQAERKAKRLRHAGMLPRFFGEQPTRFGVDVLLELAYKQETQE